MKMMTKKHDYNLILQNKIGVMMTYQMMGMLVMEVMAGEEGVAMEVLLGVMVMQGVMIIMIRIMIIMMI